jgi:ABC-type antimicrobial peptide transport system permease subunit
MPVDRFAISTIRSLIGWPTEVVPSSLALGIIVAVGVSLFFSYYPVRRAARLDPIAALRYA